MPNQLGAHLEQRIIAFALGHPGFGARRISTELRREKWGGLEVSEHGVWRVLSRFGLNTRSKRLTLVARHRDPYERKPEPRRPRATSTLKRPAKGPAGLLLRRPPLRHQGNRWAIHGRRRRLWLRLGVPRPDRNPRSRFTAELVHLVARELKDAGWKLREITSDNGSEFRAHEFRDAVEGAGARQRFIKAGNPNSNGCVERLQLTILEECWRPAFARSLVPKISGLRRDLAEYLDYFNTDRAHTGG